MGTQPNGITQVKQNGVASQGQVAAAAAASPTYAELKARIEQLEAEKALAAIQVGSLTVRIAEFKKDEKGNILKDEQGKPLPGSGAIIVNGLGRFGTTLYASQWERLLQGVEAPVGTTVHAILAACKDPRASRKAAK